MALDILRKPPNCRPQTPAVQQESWHGYPGFSVASNFAQVSEKMQQLQAALVMCRGAVQAADPETPSGDLYAPAGVGRCGAMGEAWKWLAGEPLRLPDSLPNIELAVRNQ